MSANQRERAAQAQADLIRALVAGGPIPAGFDETRVRTAARSLVNKRRHALTRIWPRLAAIVGESYVDSFTIYATSNPLPDCANTGADGREFLRWLESRQALSDAARIEALAFDAHFTITPRGLRRRRGFHVSWLKRRETGGWVVVLRVPWIGEWWWGLEN
ncbi:MAG: hypothetical protein HYR84_08760 [Planctomycetes bacterium]|nr:hypothetical protein [Planctomycetota bacterium]